MTPLAWTSPARRRSGQLPAKSTSLDMLINNAGIMLRDDLTDSAVLERHLAVNPYGPYAVTLAFCRR